MKTDRGETLMIVINSIGAFIRKIKTICLSGWNHWNEYQDPEKSPGINIHSHLIGDLLVSSGIISRPQLEEALAFQQLFFKEAPGEKDLDRAELVSKARKTRHKVPRLGQILVKKGFVSEKDLALALETSTKRVKDLCRLDSNKLAMALESGFIINSTLDLVEVLALIMKHASIVTDSVASTLMLMDEKTGELVFSVPTGPNADELEDIRIPPGEGIAGWVAENEKYLLVPDTQKDPRFYSDIDAMTGTKTKSLLCVPMKSKRKLIGVLEVINKQNDSVFVEEDALLLSFFSHHAAIAIENAMLFNAMQNRLEKEKSIAQKVAESERLRSIDTLSGGIAHDFNNILYMIVGNSELALEYIPKSNPAYNNLEEIKSASLKAAGIVKQLLNFSRKTDEKLMPIDAVTVIKDSLKFLRSTIPTTVEIHEHMPDDEIVILADSTQIHRIMMNLCINASQAMEETGGTLKISIEKIFCEAEDMKAFPDLIPGNYLKITVNDTGPGISPKIINQIFDPYFTTKKMGKGSGMGLSIVLGIIKNHGGAIWVDSSLGKGTAFIILFPMVEKKTVIKAKTEDEYPSGTETILFVDDEKSITDMVQQVLEKLGYKVETRLNPLEALGLFQSKPDSFDLVITDMTMPQMTGAKLSEKLIEIQPDVPIIICTGHSSLIDEEKAKRLGIAGYIMKPATMSTIAKAIRNVLDK